MAPLNHWHMLLAVYKRQSVPLVVNNKSKNTKSLWNSKGVWINSFLIMLHSNSVVRLKHNELHLDIISYKWIPISSSLLFERDLKINMIFNEVVFWVRVLVTLLFLAYFVVKQFSWSQNTWLLHNPVY